MQKEVNMYKKFKSPSAFTLAEVLITLGIIGVVAAVTLNSIKHIRYAGYAEKFLKTYSEIQQAHVPGIQK